MFYVDAHCDSISTERATPQLDFERMRVTPNGIQFMACFSSDLAAVGRMLDKLDKCGVPSVLSRDDIDLRGWRILRSVEGGGCLFSPSHTTCGSEEPEQLALRRLDYLHSRGVRAMGLTWNDENPLSGGASSQEKGLTELGAAVILHMEELGMAVDLAHISRSGFWGALEASKKPPIVSHTAADALNPHNRNLTDRQIRAIAERGGVIGVCLYPEFLCTGDAELDTVVRHVGHIRNIGGCDCVGIGTDFDGIDSLPNGISGVQDMPKLLSILDEKIVGLNFARVLKDILP